MNYVYQELIENFEIPGFYGRCYIKKYAVCIVFVNILNTYKKVYKF